MKKTGQMLAGWTSEALYELAFTYERPSHAVLQSEILAYRSTEEINHYLQSRIRKLRHMCDKKRSIVYDELYVVFRNPQPDPVECVYLYGEAYHYPPLLFPTREELRGMWEYAWTLGPGPMTCEFDLFVEKKILELLHELYAYETVLEGEIVLLPYALRCPEGTAIHNALYAKAKEDVDLFSEREEKFARSRAPLHMRLINDKRLYMAKEALQILGSAKVRNAY